VVADHHPDVSREKQIGKRRKRKADLVQGSRNRPALLLGSLDDHLHDLFGRKRAESLAQLIGRNHVHGLGDQVIPAIRLLQKFGEQIAYVIHLCEPS
jgi:hypothetical protein